MAADSQDNPSDYETEAYGDGGSKDEKSNWEAAARQSISEQLTATWDKIVGHPHEAIRAAIHGREGGSEKILEFFGSLEEWYGLAPEAWLKADPRVDEGTIRMMHSALQVLVYASTLARNHIRDGTPYHEQEQQLHALQQHLELLQARAEMYDPCLPEGDEESEEDTDD